MFNIMSVCVAQRVVSHNVSLQVSAPIAGTLHCMIKRSVQKGCKHVTSYCNAYTVYVHLHPSVSLVWGLKQAHFFVHMYCMIAD